MKSILSFGILATLFIFFCCSNSTSSPTTIKLENDSNINYVKQSKQLLEAIKNKANTDSLQQQLADVSPDILAAQLTTDDAKKAFWINLYNAYIQTILAKNSKKFDDRGNFFSNKQIIIAGKLISFDDIEHGIIRGSRSKWTLGLTRKIFVDDFEKKFRVNKRDGRIHFALNCGAKSCPKVAIYDASAIDEQLDKAAVLFLESSSTYHESKNTVDVTALFSWFRGDFGGKKGVKKYLKKYDIIPKESNPKLNFTKYDWTLLLDNYIDL